MKEKILNLIGKNHTTPLDFQKSFNEVYGLYTYKNNVYVFREGEDIPFDNLSEKEKNEVLNNIENKKYKLNKSLQ